MEKKLSIIIPALNEEKFIEKTLKAMCDQTVKRRNYEIIVVDSMSSDNTNKIAKRYADKVIKCKRVGAGYARNKGAEVAETDKFCFVDADTLVASTYVEGAIEALDKCVGATGPMEPLEKCSLWDKFWHGTWSLSQRLSVLVNHPYMPGFNIGIRADVFRKIGGFLPDVICEDIALSVQMKKYGKACFTNKMAVKSSIRRAQKIGWIKYYWGSYKALLFGNHMTWEEYMMDWQKK